MKICAMSDLHGFRPEIPACDVLLIAGDVCPDRVGGSISRNEPWRQLEWYRQNTVPWIEDAIRTKRVRLGAAVTWGNHDFCGQLAAGKSAPFVIVDGERNLEGVRVWLTPWSRTFFDWAFMKSEEELAAIYAKIPKDIDVLVTHQPPFGYVDQSGALALDGRRASLKLGSTALLEAIDRAWPKLVLCGHIHGGHGYDVHNGVEIYNVSVVDEQYRMVNRPTLIDFTAVPTSRPAIHESAVRADGDVTR